MPKDNHFKQKYLEAALNIQKNYFCVGTSVLNAYKKSENISLWDAVVATRRALQEGSVQKTGNTYVDLFSKAIARSAETKNVLVVETRTTKKGFEKSSAMIALVQMVPLHTELAVKGNDQLVNPGSDTSAVNYSVQAGNAYRPLIKVPSLSPMQSVNR